MGRQKGVKNIPLSAEQDAIKKRMQDKSVKMHHIYLTAEARVARLEVIRGRLNLTQIDFARKLGIAACTYNQFVYGRKQAGIAYVKLAERLLGAHVWHEQYVKRYEARRAAALLEAHPEIEFDTTV